MMSFPKVLTHAKNTDNCCWIYSSKNILFMFSLFKKRKSHKFSSFSYPGSRKLLTSAKIMISDQKCCCHLMQDSLKYLCIQVGYDWTKNKEMFKGVEEGGVLMDPLPLPTYLTSKKPNPCRVNSENYCYIRRV